MRVTLAYGKAGLEVELPGDATTVVGPRFVPGAGDPLGMLRTCLANPVSGAPLSGLVSKGQRVAIAVCDGTRAQPRRLMLPVLLEELERVVSLDDVVVIVATGTHRANTDDELVEMLGQDVCDAVEVTNHDARDDSGVVWMGRHGSDVPVWLNRRWVEADFRVTTGFVEPHFFAGFSGGPKMVAPGMAALETVLRLHDAYRIGHPLATWGIIEGNPVHDDVRAIAAATGVDFAFDVVMNNRQEIVAAFSGELFAMHAAAVEAARSLAMAPVGRLFDLVVTTNSGFPLDQNLYQSVKGMSAAERVVRPGGLILCAAECRDGFPDHGPFRELLVSEASPERLLGRLEASGETVADQWQAQILAKIQRRARVAIHTDGISPGSLAEAHLQSCSDIEVAVAEEASRQAREISICVLPDGPQTIPVPPPE